MGARLWQRTSALLRTSPLPSPRLSKGGAVQWEDLANTKDNSQPKPPHPDAAQALTKILALNKDRES